MRNNLLSSSLNSVVSLDMDSSWAARSWDNWSLYQVPYKKSSARDILLSEPEPLWSTNLSQGKVRQLFQERRGKGWDKSNPLEPLKNKRNKNTEQNPEPLTKSLGNIADNSIFLSQTLPDKAYFYTKLPNIGGTMQSSTTTETSSAKKRISRIPQPNERLKSPALSATKDIRKLTISPRNLQGDVIGNKPKSTEIKKTSPEKEVERTRSLKADVIGNKPKSTEIKRTSPEKEVERMKFPKTGRERRSADSFLTNTSTKENHSTERINSAKNTVKPNVSNPDMPTCSICGRSFAADRIELHEKICKKSKTKKRKVFDPVKQRLAGTEAETYVRKGASHQKATTQPTAKKSDWRKKHEEFLANIRAAKEVKAHLAKGGKLSDLPPPPPLDTSDYMPCPHCGRKFNQAAAERHIPKCANMKHNKPKKNIKK